MSRPRDRAPRGRTFGRFFRPLVEHTKVEISPAFRVHLQKESGLSDEELDAAIQEGTDQFRKDFIAELDAFRRKIQPPYEDDDKNPLDWPGLVKLDELIEETNKPIEDDDEGTDSVRQG